MSVEKTAEKEELLREFKTDFALFIEAGFIAVKQLDEVAAVRLFKAAQVLSPESVAPQIGLGYIALNKLEVKEAMAIFQTVLKKEPENYLAQTFFGMCHLLTKGQLEKGEELIRDALAKSDDETIKHLAKVALEWGEKDLRKHKAPFFEIKK